MSKLYRDYGPAILMLGASLVLVLVLLVEWLHFRGVRADLKARLAVKESVVPAGGETEVVDYSLPTIEQFSEMTQRPLFMEGRRPAPEEDQPVAEQTPVEQKPLNIKLMGIVFTPKDKTALFVDEKGKYRRVRKSALVDGWKLIEVREDRVVMEQGSEQKELPLIKPKPKAATPPTPKTGKAQIRGPGQQGEPNGEETDGSDVTDENDGSDGSEETDGADGSDGSEEAIDESTEDSSESDEVSDEQE